MVASRRRAIAGYALAAVLACVALLTGCDGTDRTPPSITILDPAPGDTLRGTVTVRARARDNDRVALVELLVDGELVATDSTTAGEIYSFTLNAAALTPDTFHAINCAAADRAGNRDTSPPVRVFVWPGTRHSGTLWADETWTSEGNPHTVSGALVVRAVLTIAAGAEVQFERDAGMSFVGTAGRLRAEGGSTLSSAGVSSEPAIAGSSGRILLTGRALSPGPGFWRSLSFLSDAAPSILRSCVIEYGGVMVSAEPGAAIVEDCSLRYASGHGAVFSSTVLGNAASASRFARNTVVGCGGYGILVGLDETDIVEPTNRFAQNLGDGIGLKPGTVTRSLRWEPRGAPYYVTGTIDVGGPDEPILTIAPGCSLLFVERAALRVGLTGPAGLIADGAAPGQSLLFARHSPLAIHSSSSLATRHSPFTPHPLPRARGAASGGGAAGITLASAGPAHWSGLEIWHQAIPSFTVVRRCVIDRAGSNAISAVISYIPFVLSDATVRASASSGVRASGAGFLEFSHNTITGCAGYPLEIGPDWAGTLGDGNALTGNRSDSIAVGTGSVTRTATWRNHGVPYRFSGPVAVGSASMPTLTVQPGTKLAFAPGASLEVGRNAPGDLIARGVPDSITFSGLLPQPGAWPGIRCWEATGGRTEFQRCRMLYGGEDGKGILYLERTAPLVTACEIGWSAACCIGLRESWLEPERLRQENWLHDWDPDHDDICEDEDSPSGQARRAALRRSR